MTIPEYQASILDTPSCTLYTLVDGGSTDLSGNGNDRSGVVGSQVTGQAALARNLGPSVRFQGNGWWQYPRPFTPTGSWAIEYWFQRIGTTNPDASWCVADSTATYADASVLVYHSNGGVNLTKVSPSQTDGINSGPNTAVGPTHLAIIKNSANSTLQYVLNGTAFSPAYWTPTQNHSGFVIGGARPGFWREFDGLISDFAVFDGSLGALPSVADVRRRYSLARSLWPGSSSPMVMG